MSYSSQPSLDAVLFDRDGTLVVDVPYNGDPDQVRLMPGADTVVRALRRAGIAVGIVTNQSGIGRGLITREQADAVNARVAELVGGVDVTVLCPHVQEDGCECRKPAPGMIREACRRLGTVPQRVAMIGDIGADMEAASTAGARAVMVPTLITRPQEIAAAPLRAASLAAAVHLLLPSLDLEEAKEEAAVGGVS